MHFKISKGVSTLAYDPDLNLIATGSSDNCVRAWNPYVMEKSMAVLKGHGTGVVFVLPREGEHQIIRYINIKTNLMNCRYSKTFSNF